MSNLTLKHTPNDYAAAAKVLGDRKRAVIGHNTELVRNDVNEIVATYHDNPIVSYTPEGVWASWAGWATHTTTRRLHMLAPGRYNIKNREPHINDKQVSASAWTKVS
jgi:hypothetical protein